MITKTMDFNWYLYLIPFKGENEFKFGKGRGVSNLNRIVTHQSRKKIDLSNAYIIYGSKRSISRLEGELKADYSTSEYLLNRESLEENYPRFIKDGYTEIRKMTCLNLMLEHIHFKRTRPSVELSELNQGITLPIPQKRKKRLSLTKKKKEVYNQNIFHQIDAHKKFLLQLLRKEHSMIGVTQEEFFLKIRDKNILNLVKAKTDNRPWLVNYWEDKPGSFIGINLGLMGWTKVDNEIELSFSYRNVELIENKKVAEEFNIIINYLSSLKDRMDHTIPYN